MPGPKGEFGNMSVGAAALVRVLQQAHSLVQIDAGRDRLDRPKADVIVGMREHVVIDR